MIAFGGQCLQRPAMPTLKGALNFVAVTDHKPISIWFKLIGVVVSLGGLLFCLYTVVQGAFFNHPEDYYTPRKQLNRYRVTLREPYTRNKF